MIAALLMLAGASAGSANDDIIECGRFNEATEKFQQSGTPMLEARRAVDRAIEEERRALAHDHPQPPKRYFSANSAHKRNLSDMRFYASRGFAKGIICVSAEGATGGLDAGPPNCMRSPGQSVGSAQRNPT